MHHEDQPRENPVGPDRDSTTDPSAERLHAYVSGKVQGVWFRASTQQEARRLGLTGWVRNRYDGRVELVAEGPRDTLETLVDWCHRGPDLARVVDVLTDWSAASGDFDDFTVADTLR